MKSLWTVVCAALVLALPAGAQDTVEPRPFRLGFTPFPYDISFEAVDFSYAAIAQDADIIMHHFDNGVPWPEALAGDPWPAGFQEEIEERLNRTAPELAMLLSLTPINFMRDGLAPYRGDEGEQPLPAAWEGRAFDELDVINAYARYAMRMIDFFEPDYVNIGIEVNILLNKRPDLWPGYLALQEATYTTLKAAHPELPIFVSVLGVAYVPGAASEYDVEAQRAALPDILASSDYYALSIYPYTSAYTTGPLPESFFEQMFGLSDKPLAISETGYPAQAFTVYGVTFEGTQEKQADYIGRLLEQAQQRQMIFVINFVLRDYDALWEKIGGGDLAAVWRDTGLYDEDGTERAALRVWRDALARPYEPTSP
jgi:hypothetical protein